MVLRSAEGGRMNPVSEKIIGEAKEEIEDILRRGKDRCAVLRDRLEKEFDELRASGEKRISEEAASLKRQREALAAREIRMDLLREKRLILSSLEEEMVNEIRSRAELYHGFIITCLFRSVQTGREEIVVCSDDLSLFTEAFVKEISDNVASYRKMEVALTLSSERINEPGFLLRDGRTVTDARLGFVVASAVRENEAELAGILFPADDTVRRI